MAFLQQAAGRLIGGAGKALSSAGYAVKGATGANIQLAQEARVGSGRKGAEIGKTDRTYQERRLQDRNIDDIVSQEIEKIRGCLYLKYNPGRVYLWHN